MPSDHQRLSFFPIVPWQCRWQTVCTYLPWHGILNEGASVLWTWEQVSLVLILRTTYACVQCMPVLVSCFTRAVSDGSMFNSSWMSRATSKYLYDRLPPIELNCEVKAFQQPDRRVLVVFLCCLISDILWQSRLSFHAVESSLCSCMLNLVYKATFGLARVDIPASPVPVCLQLCLSPRISANVHGGSV